MFRKEKIAFTVFILLTQLLAAQKIYLLEVHPLDKAKAGTIKYHDRFRDLKALNNELNDILSGLYNDGHITASFDSINYDSTKVDAYLYQGPEYTMARLNPGNIDPVILDATGYKEKFYRDKPFSLSEISKLHESILEYCEEHGYPFASVNLDSIIINNDTVVADLNLRKNNLIVIDSIWVKGSSKIKQVYLYNYLDIKPGDIYDESKIKQIGQRINDLVFAREIKPFEIGFTKDKAILILYLDKKKASQFDGIIGITPTSQASGNVMLTGDVKLKLVSILNRGDMLDFNWRRLGPQSQDLKLNIVYPFLFSTPFGIDYKLWLLKQDTTFLTLNNNIGLQYHIKSNNYLKIYYEAISSSLLSADAGDTLTEIPQFAGYRSNNYGLEYHLTALDYLLNPRKGIFFRVMGSFGKKSIDDNFIFHPEVHDSLELVNTIYKAGLDFAYYIPFSRSITLLLDTRNAYIWNNSLFDNELYRIGGLKTLRGFDEESIFASMYSIFNIELRYIFEKNAYFSIFWNGGYYEKNTSAEFVSDTPWGFGASLSFETGAGIFSVVYAMGKQFNNTFEFRAAKVHFGYTSVF